MQRLRVAIREAIHRRFVRVHHERLDVDPVVDQLILVPTVLRAAVSVRHHRHVGVVGGRALQDRGIASQEETRRVLLRDRWHALAERGVVCGVFRRHLRPHRIDRSVDVLAHREQRRPGDLFEPVIQHGAHPSATT